MIFPDRRPWGFLFIKQFLCTKKRPNPFGLSLLLCNAGDRNRTGTGGKSRRILSPVRLPVPPRRHLNGWKDSNRLSFLRQLTQKLSILMDGEGFEPLVVLATIDPKTFYPNGWRRIRTFEVVDNRFTVCPLWPLGNPSILSGSHLTEIYYT